MMSTTRMLTCAVFLAVASGAAHAGVTIQIVDNGPDVVITASGTLNVADLTDEIGRLAPLSAGMADFGGAVPSSQALVMGNPVSAYTLRSGPTFAGSPYPFFGAERATPEQLAFSTAAGDLVSVGFNPLFGRVGIGVSDGFVNGSAVSASGTFTGIELSRLGVAAGDTFGWTWGSGPPENFLVINVSAVPEPSTYILMSLALGIVGWAAQRAKLRRTDPSRSHLP